MYTFGKQNKVIYVLFDNEEFYLKIPTFEKLLLQKDHHPQW